MSTGTTTPARPTTDGTHARDLRPAGVAGIAATLLLVGAFSVLPADPGGTSPTDIAARYADGSTGYLRAAALESLSLLATGLLLAGLATWASRGSRLLGQAVAIGGAVLVGCQLAGYAVISTLAAGAAERGEAVMALYDLSALLFVASCAGLALAAGATAVHAFGGGGRTLGGFSAVVALAAAGGSLALAEDGFASPHGDLGFLVLVLQLLWTAAAGVALLRRR